MSAVSEATNTIKFIQVGAGAMGRSWLSLLSESADVELVGLVDLDQFRAREAATDFGFSEIPVAAALSQLPDDLGAQAVLNVTVPEAHAAVTIEALTRGLPVLCEKPLAHTVSAGLCMIGAAEVTDQLLMVSQSRRYFRTLSAFRRQISKLGRLGLLSCEFFKAPRFGGFRERMDYPLIIEMAIHQFDLARDLTRSEPVSVSCESHNPPWSWFAGDAAAEVNFEMSAGQRFSFIGSWCSPGLETSWNGQWRVSGEFGTALWDGAGPPVAKGVTGEPIEAEVPDEPEQIAGSLAEFLFALRTGTTPQTEAHANLLSLAMMEAAIASASRRERILIAEVLETAYSDALRIAPTDTIRSALLSSAQPGRRAPA